MAAGTGLQGFAAFSAESTYGTYVAPTRAIEVTSMQPKKNKNTAQGTGIAAGELVDRSARRVVTTSDAAGSMKADVTTNGFGLLLAQLLGSSATPVQQAATIAYLQTHNLADSKGFSMSAQVGAPQTDGTLVPYTFLGTKVTGAQFDCKKDGLLTSSFDLDCQTVSEAQSAITPAYTNTNPFAWEDLSVTLGAFGAEALPTGGGVTGISLKVTRALKTDRFYGDGTGLKKEPLSNGKIKVTGTIDADFGSKADFADRFRDDTPFSLIITFKKPTAIATTYYPQIVFSLPAVLLDTDGPTLDGLDVLNKGYNFTALFDGTHPALTVTYQSTDTAV